jgi:hypothetical protein
VAALLLLLAVLILWRLLIPDTDFRLEAIRKGGYPVTPAELDAWYRHVADAQNNALIYERVFALPEFTEAESRGEGFMNTGWLKRGRPLTGEDKSALETLVVDNEAALRLLHSTSASNGCRYTVDLTQGFSSGVPHLAKIKQGVLLLTSEGIWRATEGESHPASDAFLAAGRLADSISEEPLLISQLVRFACWNIIVARLESMLSLTNMTDQDLISLQAMLSAAEKAQPLVRGLAGERALGLSVFNDPNPIMAGSGQQVQGSGDRFAARAGASLLKTIGIFQKDKTFYLDTMAGYLWAAHLPFPAKVNAGQTNSGAIPRYCIISRMLLSAISRTFIREGDTIARLRIARTSLAIERFRLQHGGTRPRSLDDLAPYYFDSVPTDPYDGSPVRFKGRESGYVVYSIGSDGQDNGGLELQPKKLQTPHDITFIVEH